MGGPHGRQREGGEEFPARARVCGRVGAGVCEEASGGAGKRRPFAPHAGFVAGGKAPLGVRGGT